MSANFYLLDFLAFLFLEPPVADPASRASLRSLSTMVDSLTPFPFGRAIIALSAPVPITKAFWDLVAN